MAHIAVLGLGNWGTAIARLWLLEGHKVKGWTIEQEVYESIMMESVNQKYLANYPVEGLDVTMHLEEAIEGSEIVVLAVPSSVILDVMEDVLPHLQPGHVLLDLAKGLAPGKRLISEAIHTRLKEEGKTNPLAVLTGPTIAPEAASGVMTTALVASEDQAIAQRLAHTLSSPSFILHPASDPVGAELWGAYKNVVALACGLVDGLKQVGDLGGDNLKAAIFMSGFKEGCLLLAELGARAEVACTSQPPHLTVETEAWVKNWAPAFRSMMRSRRCTWLQKVFAPVECSWNERKMRDSTFRSPRPSTPSSMATSTPRNAADAWLLLDENHR